MLRIGHNLDCSFYLDTYKKDSLIILPNPVKYKSKHSVASIILQAKDRRIVSLTFGMI